MYEEKQIDRTELLYPVKVKRTIIHRRNMAPAGCVFFVATAKGRGKIYTISRIVKTINLTNDDEVLIQEDLAQQLRNHFKL